MRTTHRPASTLWSALRYPALELERLALDDEQARPHVVTCREGPRCVVLHADRCAVASGVRPGLTLSGARAMVPALVAFDHDPQATAARLDQLALGAHRYSSQVALAPVDTVLVEIGASLRLFGGLGALLARMRADAAAEQVQLLIGTAPTPTAALLLVRAGDERPVRTRAALGRAIAPLPLTPLQLEPQITAGLTRSGVRTIGRLCEIAPASLSRRFGHALVDTLYRIDGRLPDPQVPVVVPPAFEHVVELPLEATTTGALTFAVRRLIGSLAGFLRARDLGAGALVLLLRHRRHAPTRIIIRFTEPTADPDHLRRTTEDRLSRAVLAEPVTHLVLASDALAAIERDAGTLLETGGARRASRAAVIDALVARFGEERVYTVRVRDEHRPEASSGRVDGLKTTGSAGWPARPLWLLEQPVLAMASLELASVPERIETGWWQTGTDARRDYFIARDERGVHYWVFRARGDSASPIWIHGLFS